MAGENKVRLVVAAARDSGSHLAVIATLCGSLFASSIITLKSAFPDCGVA